MKIVLLVSFRDLLVHLEFECNHIELYLLLVTLVTNYYKAIGHYVVTLIEIVH